MTGKEAERLAVLEVQVAALLSEVRELRADMRPMRDAFQQRKGAMWILFVLGSIIGAVIAGASNLSRLFGH